MEIISRVSPFVEAGNKQSGSLIFVPPLTISYETMTLIIEATMELVSFSKRYHSAITQVKTHIAPVAKIPVTINFLLRVICMFQIYNL